MYRVKTVGLKLLALAIVLGWTTYALADEATSGTVKSVDTGRSEIVLKGLVKDTTYDVNKDAAVFLDGLSSKFSDLREGDKVHLTYAKSGERMKVSNIHALRNASETTGTIRDIFMDKKEVTLKGVIKDTTYELAKNGHVWIDGKQATLKDLRTGDQVSITYEKRGDHFMANAIDRLKNK